MSKKYYLTHSAKRVESNSNCNQMKIKADLFLELTIERGNHRHQHFLETAIEKKLQHGDRQRLKNGRKQISGQILEQQSFSRKVEITNF